MTMTMTGSSRPLSSWRLSGSKVALFAINVIAAYGIMKASRNLSSNLDNDNIHLPPTHNGQGERESDDWRDWNTSNSDAAVIRVREGGNAWSFLQVIISLSLCV